MKFLRRSFFAVLAFLILLSGCSRSNAPVSAGAVSSDDSYPYYHDLNIIDDNYRTYYEIFVGSFYDSDGDGMGDLNGVTQKLDYLNDGKGGGLGVTGIWLMPVMPSPSYHKYDVTDYYNIDPAYGTMDDFKNLVAECHKRGIKLIIDYELNHTSSQNPWFQAATDYIVKNPEDPTACPYFSYYNFTKGKPATGNYYRVGNTNWYYEAEFTSDMPDLNLDSSTVRDEIQKFTDFWLAAGVDGFRLDAALHFYGAVGASDTTKNIAFLNWFSDYCKTIKPDVYIVGEVWGNASTIAQYYQSDATSFFNFPFSQKDGFIADVLNRTGLFTSAQAYAKELYGWQLMMQSNNGKAIDAVFLGNHDTDRAAEYFSGDELKTKMAAGMYLTMGGNAFIYYGEEIGMTGGGKDENKRRPMLWSVSDTAGMTNGPAGMTSPSYLYDALDQQIQESDSIYHYYQMAVRLRNENPEIARGTLEILSDISDPDLYAVRKSYNGSQLILVYNISESAKTLELGKSQYGYSGLRGYLSANGEAVGLSGDELQLPPMSIAVLK